VARPRYPAIERQAGELVTNSDAHARGDLPDLVAPVPIAPEGRTTFRIARLLLFLDVATSKDRPVTSVDRLGYYEFFADNPFIVVEGDTPAAEADRLDLELAGFSPVHLAYASSGQRFASRRQRLQHDLALLIARGLVAIDATGFRATESGVTLAQTLNSVYADAYRTSAAIVLRRLSALSTTALDKAARRWLGESWLLIDLLDNISATDAPTVDQGNSAHGSRTE
jgi:ABC-three component (ABC-3C) system Middle Component 2